MYDRYDSKSGYGYGDSSYGPNVRRSRSIHAKFAGGPGGPGASGPGTRRNPYDYLPDEPVVGLGGAGGPKPDIMQTSVDQSGGTRLLGGSASGPGAGPGGTKPGGASPRYGTDSYANEKMTDAYGSSADGVYGTRSKGGEKFWAFLFTRKASLLLI